MEKKGRKNKRREWKGTTFKVSCMMMARASGELVLREVTPIWWKASFVWTGRTATRRRFRKLTRWLVVWVQFKAALVDLFEIIFLLFKLHRQIFFKKSCFFVSFRDIVGVFDTGVWSLDHSREYFSSKISIAKSLYFLLFHFIFFSRCEMLIYK